MRAILVGFLVAGGTIISVPWQMAHASQISAGAQLGAGHLPLAEWRSFVEGVENATYGADRLGLYGDAYCRAEFGRHGVRVSVGAVTTSAHSTFVSVLNPAPGSTTTVVDWDFTSVPIGIYYELRLGSAGAGTTPFVGFGPNVCWSRVESKTRTLYPPDLATLFGELSGKRDGWGYGLCSYIGQRITLTNTVLFSTMLRGQWVDGMGFSDSSDDVPVHFSGVDVSMGIEWAF